MQEHRSLKKRTAHIYDLVCIGVWCAHAMVHVWSQRTSAEVSSAFLPCSAGTESGWQAWHLLLYLPSRLAAHSLHAFLSFSTKLNNIPVFRFITINLTWFLLLLICVAFNFLMFKIRLNHGLCILDPNRGSVHTFFFFFRAGDWTMALPGTCYH